MQTQQGALVPIARGTYEEERLRVIHVVDAREDGVPAWGRERAVQALMQTQRDSGLVEPEFVCFSWGQLAADLTAARFSVCDLNSGSGALSTKAVTRFKRLIGAGPIPVVHTHSHRANLLGRMARLMGARMQRLVASHHGWEEPGARAGFFNRIDRQFSGLSDAVTVPDAMVAHLFPRSVRVVHLADAIAYQPLPTEEERAQARAAYGLRKGDFVAGFFGRINEMGGALELLRAARGTEDRGIVWAIAGDGELASNFQVAGLKNVRLLGEIDNPEAFFAALDTYVQPSHHETLSPALLAAMRAGVPSVATRVGATELAARHDIEGLIIEPGDAEDLLQRVVLLKRSPLVRTRLAAAARTRFETAFDIRFQHEALLELYRYGGLKRV
ncbi:MAG TPA: glycosyltransferase family 4 protein [Candidatus Acidoferrales bacterium]|nr:glycosyltransferase family 4 protein [Candidatus Acidoferrales bacterium]